MDKFIPFAVFIPPLVRMTRNTSQKEMKLNEEDHPNRNPNTLDGMPFVNSHKMFELFIIKILFRRREVNLFDYL